LLVHAHFPPLTRLLELSGHGSQGVEQAACQHVKIADVQNEFGVVDLLDVIDLVVISRLPFCQTNAVPRSPVITLVPTRQSKETEFVIEFIS